MLNKKFAIIIAVSSVFWLQGTKIQVPENIDEKFNYKLIYVIFRGSFLIGELAEKLNYGSQPSNVKYLLDEVSNFVSKLDPLPTDIRITNEKIKGVNARVFKPVSIKDKKSPVMIYYHGGGFMMGSPKSYDEYLIDISKKTNSVIIAVDYKKAPIHPFPSPIEECYTVTKYVLESGNEFGDINRVILAGDSAGGTVVAVMTQRLNFEKKKLPKLQVLIYPWTQAFDNRSPSGTKYGKTGVFDLIAGKFISWYLGIVQPSEEVIENINSNNHTILVKDKKLKENFKSYTDVSLIPSKYKSGKSYYNTHELIKNKIIPDSVDKSNILLKDKKLANKLQHVFTTDISPGIAEPERLKGLPKALFIMCEIDALKDQGLIYSERLRNAGVPVDVHFYENCFHGCAQFINQNLGFKVAREMKDNLIDFISQNI